MCRCCRRRNRISIYSWRSRGCSCSTSRGLLLRRRLLRSRFLIWCLWRNLNQPWKRTENYSFFSNNDSSSVASVTASTSRCHGLIHSQSRKCYLNRHFWSKFAACITMQCAACRLGFRSWRQGRIWNLSWKISKKPHKPSKRPASKPNASHPTKWPTTCPTSPWWL